MKALLQARFNDAQTRRTIRNIQALDFGEFGALRDGTFRRERTLESFQRTVDTTREQVDQLFGATHNRAWHYAANALAMHLPVSVPRVVAMAQLEKLEVRQVLSIGGVTNIPLTTLRVAAPQALAVGVSFCLGLPIWATFALQGLAFVPYACPWLDPTLFLLHRVTGIGYEPSAHGEVNRSNRSLVVHAPIFMKSGVDPDVVMHEMLHVVDFSCGGPDGLSAEPDFVALYDAIVSGNATPPSAYSLHSTHELFTEGAVAFLGLSSDMTSRDLRDKNPALWSYFEKLFGERLPSIVADGAVRPASTWTSDVSRSLRLMHPLYREPGQLLVDFQRFVATPNLTDELDEPLREEAQRLHDRVRAYLARDVAIPRSPAFRDLVGMTTHLRTIARSMGELLAANA